MYMYARINAYKQYLNINIQKMSKIEKISIRILNLNLTSIKGPFVSFVHNNTRIMIDIRFAKSFSKQNTIFIDSSTGRGGLSTVRVI